MNILGIVSLSFILVLAIWDVRRFEKMEKMTQLQMIIRHLTDYGTITALEALEDYGVFRLASRIGELRDDGYRITSERLSSVNRYGKKISYSIYKLEGRYDGK